VTLGKLPEIELSFSQFSTNGNFLKHLSNQRNAPSRAEENKGTSKQKEETKKVLESHQITSVRLDHNFTTKDIYLEEASDR